jgi:hypothetical protein
MSLEQGSADAQGLGVAECSPVHAQQAGLSVTTSMTLAGSAAGASATC